MSLYREMYSFNSFCFSSFDCQWLPATTSCLPLAMSGHSLRRTSALSLLAHFLSDNFIGLSFLLSKRYSRLIGRLTRATNSVGPTDKGRWKSESQLLRMMPLRRLSLLWQWSRLFKIRFDLLLELPVSATQEAPHRKKRMKSLGNRFSYWPTKKGYICTN